MIATRSKVRGDQSAPPSRARTVLALSRVEVRELVGHPAFVVAVALGVLLSAPFLLSQDYTREHNVGWLVQVPALFVSFGALLAASIQALKSRRDGSEELFGTAPLSQAARTVAVAMAAVGVMVVLAVLLLGGGLAVRAAGKAAATDAGHSLFPLYDLVQGPLVAGLFVLIGIAVARWVPRAAAGPFAVVALFLIGSRILNAATDWSWFRLTPFDPTFLDDSGVLQAMHVVYLGGLAAVVLAVAVLRFGWTRGARAVLVGGLVTAGVAGSIQLVA